MTAGPTCRAAPTTSARRPPPRSGSPGWGRSTRASSSGQHRLTGGLPCRGGMERTIAHLDMDAFYVSVELRRRPELRGKPVIVAGSGPRAVVTTASYEARRYGVGSAIPAARARRLCPDGVYLPPDFPYYRAASREVMDLVRQTAPAMELIGLDEAYLDLTGLDGAQARMRALARTIEERTQ